MLPRTGSGKGDRPRGVLELLVCPRRDAFTIKLVASVSGGGSKGRYSRTRRRQGILSRYPVHEARPGSLFIVIGYISY